MLVHLALRHPSNGWQRRESASFRVSEDETKEMIDPASQFSNRRQLLKSAGVIGLTAMIPGLAHARSRGRAVPDSVDLTSGLDAARELFLTQPAATVGSRDAASFWAWDNCGLIGIEDNAVEAVSPNGTVSEMRMTVTLPGGRILRNFEGGTAHQILDAEGRATHLGAGPMGIDVVLPFRRYRTYFQGTATDTTFEALLAGRTDDRRIDVDYEIIHDPIVPAWQNGTLNTGAQQHQAAMLGGYRVEQLGRSEGRIKIGGVEMRWEGGSNRVRRQGVRNMNGASGHAWQAAVFPSGRAFGFRAHPTRVGGEPSYNEGYVFLERGQLVPARVVEAPWLNRMAFNAQDVGFTLETENGRRIRIEGELLMAAPGLGAQSKGFPPLLQGIARYRWEGELGYGMTERSNLAANIANLP